MVGSKNPKCPLHRKYEPCPRCTTEQRKNREVVTITNKVGKQQNVSRLDGTYSTDRTPNVKWCSSCSCRVVNGTCSNVKCSTRE